MPAEQLVVVLSILALCISSIPISTIRLVRVFRVIRIFGRFRTFIQE